MTRFMFRYHNQPRLINDKPHKFIPKRLSGGFAPGHKYDPKNEKPGGYKRFDRWYKRPKSAWRLYWRKTTR